MTLLHSFEVFKGTTVQVLALKSALYSFIIASLQFLSILAWLKEVGSFSDTKFEIIAYLGFGFTIPFLLLIYIGLYLPRVSLFTTDSYGQTSNKGFENIVLSELKEFETILPCSYQDWETLPSSGVMLPWSSKVEDTFPDWSLMDALDNVPESIISLFPYLYTS